MRLPVRGAVIDHSIRAGLRAYSAFKSALLRFLPVFFLAVCAIACTPSWAQVAPTEAAGGGVRLQTRVLMPGWNPFCAG